MTNIQRFVIAEPTSAYEIINRVIKLVEEEPKRMRMGFWFETLGTPTEHDQEHYSKFYPACGTVACIAGWAGHVSASPHLTRGLLLSGAMKNVLGGFDPAARSEIGEAFGGGAHFLAKDGTQEQADLVIAFLSGYQAKWERQLKNWMILPGGIVQQ